MGMTAYVDENAKLTLSGIACDCPCEHSAPAQDIYIGNGLIARIPAYIKKRGLGTHCVLACDETTYGVAGQAVSEALKSDGVDVLLCVLKREGELMPDERACGEVLLSILPETEFLISVGSGTITDTVRINAMRTGLPFVAVATAPSMDGYASLAAPLLLRNFKIQRVGVCPEIIVCDLGILASAPPEMIAWGVGDVLGKYIAKADWLIGNIINDEPFCPACLGIVTDAVGALVENIEAIRDRTEDGMRLLIQALLLAGITIMIIGNTRAVASVEHNIAQFWEMKQLQLGKAPPPHGSSVGVATLLVWPLYERFAKEDLSSLNLARIEAERASHEERVRFLLHAYGDEGGASIMRENPGDFLSWTEQKRRILRAQQRFPEIQAVLNAMPPLETIRRTLGILGAHQTPEQEGIDEHLLALSLRCGKDYRSRYTLMKTMSECGLLEEYLTAYPME